MHCGCLNNNIKRIREINVAFDDIMLGRLQVREGGPRGDGRGRGHVILGVDGSGLVPVKLGGDGGQVNVEARLSQNSRRIIEAETRGLQQP